MEEVLSKFSTEELIEALRLKEDVQIADTREGTYEVSMNLMKAKKHVLVINNCNPKLIEHQRKVSEGLRLKRDKQWDRLFVRSDNGTDSKVVEIKPLLEQDLHKVSDEHAK
ncbi:hypothetical protein [Bacillus cereus]|uniref:hypothetical protein n=1 Tax=Bacillus cereus TaxID=1396 RepID=UPI00211D1F78|nr:hypothetical protein [Bacillus cereus]